MSPPPPSLSPLPTHRDDGRARRRGDGGGAGAAALVLSLLSAALFLAVGVLFLSNPRSARRIIYPCLGEEEGGHLSTLDADVVRLAGGCFLSVALTSFALCLPSLVPSLLSRSGENSERKGDGAGTSRGPPSSTHPSSFSIEGALLGMCLVLQATMGLSLVAVGVINVGEAEHHHSYNHPEFFRCSALEDQTILWTGVAVTLVTSLGIMTSFCSVAEHGIRLDKRRRIRACFCVGTGQTHPTADENLIEPLLRENRRARPSPNPNLDGGGNNVGEASPARDVPEVISAESYGDLTSIRDGGGNDGDVDEHGSTKVSEGTDQYSQSVLSGTPSIDDDDITTTDSPPAQQAAAAPSSRLRGTARLLRLAGPQSFYLYLGIFVLLIRLPFSLSIPHFVSSTIGALIDGNYDEAKMNVLMLFLLGTVDSVLDFWCIFLFGFAQEKIVRGVRVDAFTAILRQEQAFFDKTNTGELTSRLTADCGEMAQDLTWFFRFSVEAVVRITGISVYMLVRNPLLGMCALGIVPAVGIVNKFYGDWLGRNAKAVQSSLAEATSAAHEAFACIKTVITSASEDYECEKYERKIDVLYRLNIRQLIAQGVYYMVVSTFLINTCVQATLLLVGSLLVERGDLTPEVLLAFMLYQGQLQEYTLHLFQSYSSLIKSSGAGDRVFKLLDRCPAPPGIGNPEVQELSKQSDENEDKTQENIVLEDIEFSYPSREGAVVLHKLSLNIRRGSSLAIVGQSGCGKSTIISLLERLYDPDGGSIKFGGVDLRVMNLKAHRRNIGFVTQEPVLFSGSIRDNIAYGAPASFECIVEAARIANAEGFIESFANKYDTEVGERGNNLSGGQRQRIAIARAIIKKPALLLLDEATSALDPESEARVQEALNNLVRNRAGMTTVIVAHRLQTVRHADSIAVIQNGVVVEQGTHDELVEVQGHYKRMVERVDSTGLLPET